MINELEKTEEGQLGFYYGSGGLRGGPQTVRKLYHTRLLTEGRSQRKGVTYAYLNNCGDTK